MRVGLQVPNFTWTNQPGALGDTFATVAERAERAGLYSFWVMDHFFQIPNVGRPEQEMLEGYSALAFAAGRTNHIRLGTMVTGVTYRHPGLLVKTVTTLDVLSHGRAYLGIGAAWNEQEHRGLGVPFPPTAERFERLEEALQIAQQMWAGDDSPYQGTHYQLERPLNVPASVQKPHPPILIGGGGERKTLRMVAQYGDACNLFMRLGREEVQRKLDVLREHCEALVAPIRTSRRPPSIPCASPGMAATTASRRPPPFSISGTSRPSVSTRPYSTRRKLPIWSCSIFWPTRSCRLSSALRLPAGRQVK